MLVFSQLDRWLALRFLKAYLTFASAGLFLFFTIDLFANVDELSEAPDFLAALEKRYGATMPEVFFTMAPFLTLLAALWVVANLRRNNELTPLLSAGFGTRRIAWPFFVVGALLAPLAWADKELVIPAVGHYRRLKEFGPERIRQPPPIPDGETGVLAARYYQAERWEVRKRDESEEQRLAPPLGYLSDPDDWGQAADERLVYRPFEIRHLRYNRLDPESRSETLAVVAGQGTWVPAEAGGPGWLCRSGWTISRQPTELLGTIAPIGSEGYLLRIRVPPTTIESMVDRPRFLSSAQLREQIALNPAFFRLRVMVYERYSAPLAGLALLLVAVPITLRGSGGWSAFLRFGGMLLLSFLYFVATTVCFELGARGAVPPLLGAFGPPLLTAAWGGVLALWEPGSPGV